MSELFSKIATGLTFSWDIRELEKHFIDDVVDPLAKERKRHIPYSDPQGRPHWQPFPSGIAFARNFSFNFPKECAEVTDSIRRLQSELKNTEPDNAITKAFLEHRINPNLVNVVKIYAGTSVKAHDDATRGVGLNIGLANSDSCETQIINIVDNDNFDRHEAESFIMNDGDVYLLKVENTHRVNSLVTKESGLDRYLITYTVVVKNLE